MQESLLNGRTVGYFPLSIGTSKAIEGAVGFTTNEEGIVNLTNENNLVNYKQLLVNIFTLLRNAYGAYPREEVGTMDYVVIADEVLLEMERIVEIVREYSPSTEVIFYQADYPTILKKLPEAFQRFPNTAKQKQTASAYESMLKYILKESQIPIKDLLRPTEVNKNLPSLLLTHLAIDLIKFRTFQKKDLLESHTGKIKHPNEWYTKYYNGNNLPILPFNGFLLLVFGDNDQLRPTPRKLREAVLEIASKYRWTAVTTEEKVKLNIDFIKDNVIKEDLKYFFHLL